MIQYQFFPRSRGITDDMAAVVDCFNKANDQISSDNNCLESNEVVLRLREGEKKN